jgi:hypothetical protein
MTVSTIESTMLAAQPVTRIRMRCSGKLKGAPRQKVCRITHF